MEIYQGEYIKRRRERAELLDQIAWMFGMYNVSAVQTALFPKKAKYPKSPRSMREEEEVEEMSSEDQFMAWAAAFNAGHDNLPEYGEERHEPDSPPERSGDTNP